MNNDELAQWSSYSGTRVLDQGRARLLGPSFARLSAVSPHSLLHGRTADSLLHTGQMCYVLFAQLFNNCPLNSTPLFPIILARVWPHFSPESSGLAFLWPEMHLDHLILGCPPHSCHMSLTFLKVAFTTGNDLRICNPLSSISRAQVQWQGLCLSYSYNVSAV